MLDVNIEFSRGVLFVRLSGSITKDNINNIKYNIKSILEKSGIKFLVFNLSEFSTSFLLSVDFTITAMRFLSLE